MSLPLTPVSSEPQSAPLLHPYKRHEHCRACRGTNLSTYLDWGSQPLANGLLSRGELTQPEFRAPLAVQLCTDCGLSQLTHTVDPDVLYTQYPFTAGTSRSWALHCEEMADRHPAHFVLDIASNDGTLLAAFKKRGMRVLGVDPAQTILKDVKAPTICAYWNLETADRVLRFHGRPDLVIATNVFGHVDDPREFLEAVAAVIAPKGTLLIECPHILPLIEQNEFPTIYHEHLSYWGLTPLQVIAAATGWTVTDAKAFDIHCGSMRYELRQAGQVHPRVRWLADLEQSFGIRKLDHYKEFASRVSDILLDLRELLAHKHFYGYPASAKGSVLLNLLGADCQPDAIFDDSLHKWGRYTPGTHIYITEPRPEVLQLAEYLLMLGWNWRSDLKKNAMARGFKGRWIVPLPKPCLES